MVAGKRCLDNSIQNRSCAVAFVNLYIYMYIRVYIYIKVYMRACVPNFLNLCNKEI